MKIRILQDGRYNDQTRRAVTRKAGDMLETSPDYANVLVTDGLAEFIEDEPQPIAEPKKKARAPQRKAVSASGTSRNAKPNPFLN